MVDETLIRTVGFLASILGVVAWAPQVKRVWVDRRYDGVSLPTLWLVATTLALWLTYGVMIEAMELIVGNAIAVAVVLSIPPGISRAKRHDA